MATLAPSATKQAEQDVVQDQGDENGDNVTPPATEQDPPATEKPATPTVMTVVKIQDETISKVANVVEKIVHMNFGVDETLYACIQKLGKDDKLWNDLCVEYLKKEEERLKNEKVRLQLETRSLFHRDVAGNLLLEYWMPDGEVNEDHEKSIRECVKGVGVPTWEPIQYFIDAKTYQKKRIECVSELGLTK